MLEPLRAICKLSQMDRVPNEEILKICNTVSVSQVASSMKNDKMMLFGTLEGAGKRGRPVKSWNDK